MFNKTLSHACSCSTVLAGKVDQSQNINTQQLFSCWERFEIIIHQTSNETGDTKIEPAAGSHLSVFYRRKNTPFMSHVHDTEMSRWKRCVLSKQKLPRSMWRSGPGEGALGWMATATHRQTNLLLIKGKNDHFLDSNHAQSSGHLLYINTLIF